jgi:hypothetical protein
MRKIDRAFLKRTLGGDYPNGPRGSWTLRNDAEGRVYLLGWSSLYRDQFHILDAAFFGDIVERDGELCFRADERRRLNVARGPRLESA